MKTLTITLITIPFLGFGQIIKDSVKTIETVKIEGKKPLLKRKIDRLEFNIDKTPLQSLNGWEILKNTPNINIKNEQISVQGNSQIVVTINDKKTLMSQEQLKQFLENTDGNNISAVEVITNPPAKYEAEGGAVVNIKLKKDTLEGYKGRISARWHQSIYAKEKIGLMQNFNTKKWQISANYDFVTGDYVRKNLDVTIFENNKTRWESDMVRKTKSHEQHLYNFSAQYNLDSLNSVQFGFDGINQPKMTGNYRIPTVIYNTQNEMPLWNYLTANDLYQYNNGFNSYLVFDKKFGKNTLTFTNNFSAKRYRENQDVNTFLHYEDQTEGYNHFASNSAQSVKLFSSQLDYRFEKDKFTLESGLKFSNVKNENTSEFFVGNPQILVFSPDKSNVFNYNENIFAIYTSGSCQWEKWEAKAGLRAENTAIKTDSDNPKIQNRKNYFNLFPTLYLNYKISENKQLGFSYGKRISRPDYDFLNPSKSYYNLYSYFQGDADLQSTFIHNLSLSYTVKDWHFEIYYRYSKNPSMEISIQNPQTFETIYHYTNIDHGMNLGANLSKNFKITPNWTLNFFAMADYNEDYFLGTDNILRKNKIMFYNTDISSQIILDKAKTWDLNVGYGYNSKSIQGSFTISPSHRTNIILNKKLFDKKLQVGLVFNDIFKTDRNTISTDYADQHQYFKDYRDTQYFMLNVKYNFGNQKVKEVKAKEKTEEQQRL